MRQSVSEVPLIQSSAFVLDQAPRTAVHLNHEQVMLSSASADKDNFLVSAQIINLAVVYIFVLLDDLVATQWYSCIIFRSRLHLCGVGTVIVQVITIQDMED